MTIAIQFQVTFFKKNLGNNMIFVIHKLMTKKENKSEN